MKTNFKRIICPGKVILLLLLITSCRTAIIKDRVGSLEIQKQGSFGKTGTSDNPLPVLPDYNNLLTFNKVRRSIYTAEDQSKQVFFPVPIKTCGVTLQNMKWPVS
jgi:hypothetical protein